MPSALPIACPVSPLPAWVYCVPVCPVSYLCALSAGKATHLSSQSSSSARITIRRCTTPSHCPPLFRRWRVRSSNGLLRLRGCDGLWGLIVCAAAEGLACAGEIIGFLFAETVAHCERMLYRWLLGESKGIVEERGTWCWVVGCREMGLGARRTRRSWRCCLRGLWGLSLMNCLRKSCLYYGIDGWVQIRQNCYDSAIQSIVLGAWLCSYEVERCSWFITLSNGSSCERPLFMTGFFVQVVPTIRFCNWSVMNLSR